MVKKTDKNFLYKDAFLNVFFLYKEIFIFLQRYSE